MVISHNLSAINTNRQLGMVTSRKAKATERLSSGYRINRAADDAAGLTISEKMRSQIRGLTQASKNCQDGVSMVQIADGGMAEVHDMLDRCIELSVKAANETLTPEDREAIHKEISQIKEEIDQISDKTEFNTIKVLKGGEAASSHEVTYEGGLPGWVTDKGTSLGNGQLSDTITTSDSNTRLGFELDFSALTPTNVNDLADQGFYTTCCTCDAHYSIKFVSGEASSSYQSGQNSIFEVSIDGITNGEQLVSRILSTVGNNPNSHYTNFEADGSSLKVYDNRESFNPNNPNKSTPGSNSGLVGTGVAYASTEGDTPSDIVIQAGAHSENTISIKLPRISSAAIGITGADVRTPQGAKSAINQFNHGKDYVSGERSRMGAYQNRLEHTIRNLDNVVENTIAAESGIRDMDMAAGMVEFSKENILEQAGQAMLAQANQNREGILTLLQ